MASPIVDESEFPGGVDWLSEETYNMLKEKTMTKKKKKKVVKKKKKNKKKNKKKR